VPTDAAQAETDLRSAAIPQYSLAQILGVFALAALPMGALAWLVAPAFGPAAGGLSMALVICLTAGLVWQFGVVLLLVGIEQRSLRWRVVRAALWLGPPTRGARRGGRLWWMVVPYIAVFALLQLIPWPFESPLDRSPAYFLETDAGHDLLGGNVSLYVLLLVLFVFNTVLGEELLFRGLLLPRMAGVFGRADWIANGILFGLYHLHQPWSIPGSIIDGALAMAFPSARYRTAWFGIIVHSTQSMLFGVLVTAAFVS